MEARSRTRRLAGSGDPSSAGEGVLLRGESAGRPAASGRGGPAASGRGGPDCAEPAEEVRQRGWTPQVEGESGREAGEKSLVERGVERGFTVGSWERDCPRRWREGWRDIGGLRDSADESRGRTMAGAMLVVGAEKDQQHYCKTLDRKVFCKEEGAITNAIRSDAPA